MGLRPRTLLARWPGLFVGLLLGLPGTPSRAQDWQPDDQVFNPSGIPSLTFSQPRFADLDADGDLDLLLGSGEYTILYFRNTGTPAGPVFAPGPDILAPVGPLDSEVGVCVNLDGDGDLDLVTGGFTGLKLFTNAGSATAPEFVESADVFAALATGADPVPTFADLDGDLDLDLLVGMSESGALKYYPNLGTPTAAVFAEAQAQAWFDVGLYAYPWFVDLDHDLDLDLVSGRDEHGFVYERNDGSPAAWNWVADGTVFEVPGGSTYWNSPCLTDLDGNGLADLVFGTSSGPLQYYQNGGPPTDPTWTANTGLFGGVLDVGGASSPVFFDFDLDGDLDLVSGSQLGDIRYYENTGTTVSPAWHAAPAYFASIDHSIYSAIAVGRLDGDNLPDAVVGDLSGNLFFHHNNGSGFVYDPAVFAGINVGGWSVPRLVDMDGDGDLDLAVGNEAGRLRYFRNVGAGTMAWQEVTNFFGTIDVGSNCSMTFGDYDHDGDLDLLTGDLSHELQYFRHVGLAWSEDPTVVAGLVAGQNAAPALADLDADGDLDLTVGNYSGTFNYYRNTGPVTSAPDQREIDQPGLGLQATPNPFSHHTDLTFSLPAPATVELSLFDAAGRQVRQIFHGPAAAGRHALAWKPAADGGAGLPSGTYYLRLDTGAKRRVFTLTLLR